MFQPIGGMDRIPMAFAQRLDSVIRYDAAVTRIRQSDYRRHGHVQRSSSGAAKQTIAADYCICAMPLTIARTLDADFSAADSRPFSTRCQYDSAYKIAWEAPRFWETEANIYGGISYLQQPVDLVWYPSARLFSETGILIGGYSLEFRPGSPPLADVLASTSRCLPGHYGQWLQVRTSAQHAGQARRVAAVG